MSILYAKLAYALDASDEANKLAENDIVAILQYEVQTDWHYLSFGVSINGIPRQFLLKCMCEKSELMIEPRLILA